jgi:hypothetical protein
VVAPCDFGPDSWPERVPSGCPAYRRISAEMVPTQNESYYTVQRTSVTHGCLSIGSASSVSLTVSSASGKQGLPVELIATVTGSSGTPPSDYDDCECVAANRETGCQRTRNFTRTAARMASIGLSVERESTPWEVERRFAYSQEIWPGIPQRSIMSTSRRCNENGCRAAIDPRCRTDVATARGNSIS